MTFVACLWFFHVIPKGFREWYASKTNHLVQTSEIRLIGFTWFSAETTSVKTTFHIKQKGTIFTLKYFLITLVHL